MGDTRKIILNNVEHVFTVLSSTKDEAVIELNGKKHHIKFSHLKPAEIFPIQGNLHKQLFYNETEVSVVLTEKVSRNHGGAQINAGSLLSPMPGKIYKVLKKEGDSVEQGEAIFIMEAMKMEHTLFASSAGILTKVFYQEGDQVQGNELLGEVGAVCE